MSGKTCVVRHKFLSVAFVLLFFLAGWVFLSSCGDDDMAQRYGTPFSLGEGMTYRSFIFEVQTPTSNPYPVKMSDLYGYTAGTHGSHVEEVTEPVFQQAKIFTQGLGAVKQDGKWGFIRLKRGGRDKAFEYAIPPVFDGAEPFNEDLAAVKLGDKYGYIDQEGTMVIAPAFSEAHYFSGGLAAVKGEEGWFFIDAKGNTVVEGPYQEAESFFGPQKGKRFAPVKLEGKWGYIDEEGQLVIPAIYEDAWAFEYGGKAAVKQKGEWRYISFPK